MDFSTIDLEGCLESLSCAIMEISEEQNPLLLIRKNVQRHSMFRVWYQVRLYVSYMYIYAYIYISNDALNTVYSFNIVRIYRNSKAVD